jgi:excisionase family DNA binding protein
MPEELLTIHETRKELKCGHTKTYELINSGQLKAVKMGRHTRVLKSSIDALIASLPSYRTAV